MWILVVMLMVGYAQDGSSATLKTLNTTYFTTEEKCQEVAQTMNRNTWATDLLAYCAPKTDKPNPTRKGVIS